jgi:hypothetical protein
LFSGRLWPGLQGSEDGMLAKNAQELARMLEARPGAATQFVELKVGQPEENRRHAFVVYPGGFPAVLALPRGSPVAPGSRKSWF